MVKVHLLHNLWLLVLVCLLLRHQATSAQDCIETMFPSIFGGTNGDTIFNAMDIDANNNIIVGGQTSDPSIATLSLAPDPIIMFIQDGGLISWGVTLSSILYNYDFVISLKFN